MDENQTEEETPQLDKAILDKFANSMLPGLMKILDNVPDTVYRVCDLVVVVVRKYGDQWRDSTLLFILNETCDLIKQVCEIYSNSKPQPSTAEPNALTNAFTEQKLASRLLLFCLLFEEMQLPCSKIVNSSNLLDKLVAMLQMITQQSSTMSKQAGEGVPTPVWLTSLFILVDLIEKAALATKRKASINEQFQSHKRVWKWYDERQNKWIAYPYNNNKIIDTAYKNGETSVKVVATRKNYIVHFNTMLQENEETLHKRPVMLSFEKPSTPPVAPAAAAASSSSMFDTNTDSNSSNTNQTAPSLTSQQDAALSRPSSPLPTEIVNGLEQSQISCVIESCVELISWPVSDPDCLHAILRLILRLTRQYQNAIEFAARRGPQHVLQLTQRNSFMGYASLITLIFRHICEDEKNLRLTMEKAIRLALTGSQVNSAGLQPGGVGSRELHNVLRLLGPAICRHPDIFCEVACDILRIMIKREDETLINTNNLASLEQTIKQTISSNNAYGLRTIVAKLMPPTPMPDYAKELVVDLLNYLVKPIEAQKSGAGSVSKANEPKSSLAEQAAAKSSSKSSLQAAFFQSQAQLSTSSPNSASLAQQPQPLISKSGVLRILSELVRSYAGCAKIISQHVYKATDFINPSSSSAIIVDDCNALAFLLDNLLASNQTFGDKDCPSLCRLLIVALASCNHCLDSQNALVQEVKSALSRAINLPESNDKHIKIQAFASIINTIIETCPPIQNTAQQQANGLRNQPPNANLVNNMMKIMHKKGLINDLARVPLYMDLSCAKCIETLNTILKPLETMTKTLNISVRKRGDLIFPHKTQALPASALSTVVPSTATATVTASSTSETLQQAAAETRRPSGEPTQIQGTISPGRAAYRRSHQHLAEQRDNQQHSGVTSDVSGLNIASDNNLALADATGAAVSSESGGAGDEQMVDLNTTEMEPQQTLPQDVDMLPTSHHHHRRELGERVFDRVIEALNQESDSDSEYESQNRIIHIEADNEGDQIHIQIETGDDEDDEDDEDDDEDDVDDDDDEEDADIGLAGPAHDHNSSGEDEEDRESVDEDERTRVELNDTFGTGEQSSRREEGGIVDEDDDDDDESDDSDDDDDDDDEEEADEEEDDEDNVIDEEIVEGSDGRSAESDVSEDEAHARETANRIASADELNRNNNEIAHSDGGVIDTTAVAANGGVVTTSVDAANADSAPRSRRRRHRHRGGRDDLDENDEDDEDDEEDDDDDEEDMDLDEGDDDEIEDDENEIIDENEEEEDEEDENGDDEDEDEEEEEDEEENDEDEDGASEYYDAYNQMFELMNEDTGDNGEEEDFMAHIENLWQNNASTNHIVLGHQLGIGNPNGRSYQINFLGGNGLSQPGLDGTLPPHPLSVSAVHPLLVHQSESSGSGLSAQSGAGLASTGGAANNNFQISGLGINTAASGLTGLGSAISPILRTMRHHFQSQSGQQQQPLQANRAMRVSRFVFPNIQLQMPTAAAAGAQAQAAANTQAAAAQTGAPAQVIPAIRSANLPYNTLNEILQGVETPASALQPPPAPTIITAPSATSFIDYLIGNQAGQPHHHAHHGHGLGLSSSNNLSSLNNQQDFLVNLNSYNNDGFGENIGNGTTNLYIIRTPLARWNEECTVLDSHSMHHAILLNKPRIMEALERYRNEELNEKREKRLKEEKEKQKRNQLAESAAAAAAAAAAATSAAATAEKQQTQEQAAVVSQDETSRAEPQIESNVEFSIEPVSSEPANTVSDELSNNSAPVSNQEMEAEENQPIGKLF
jgi:hypothetical protein